MPLDSKRDDEHNIYNTNTTICENPESGITVNG